MNIKGAINTDDVADLARRYLPRIAYDFIDGGVDGEDGLVRNRDAFQRYRLVPRYLVDVEKRTQTTTPVRARLCLAVRHLADVDRGLLPTRRGL